MTPSDPTRPAPPVAATPVAITPVDQPIEPAARIAPQPVVATSESVTSSAGTYAVRFAPSAKALPNNESFELELWITPSATPDVPASDVELSVDAAMPEHGHGMVHAPIVERRGDGHFVARGMLLHMSGRWELYFDITRGAVTERAQISATLE